MKARNYILCCGLISLFAFWLGQRDGRSTPTRAPGAKVVQLPVPELPDSLALARKSQSLLADIPDGLWVPLEAEQTLPAVADELARMPQGQIPFPPASAAKPQMVQEEPLTSAQARIAGTLSGSISAIVRMNGAAKLVVADKATTIRQTYQIGDVYDNGWKIAGIQSDQVTLAKKGQIIKVPVNYTATLRGSSGFNRGPVGQLNAPSHPRTIGSADAGRPRRRLTRQNIASK